MMMMMSIHQSYWIEPSMLWHWCWLNMISWAFSRLRILLFWKPKMKRTQNRCGKIRLCWQIQSDPYQFSKSFRWIALISTHSIVHLPLYSSIALVFCFENWSHIFNTFEALKYSRIYVLMLINTHWTKPFDAVVFVIGMIAFIIFFALHQNHFRLLVVKAANTQVIERI